MSAGSESPIERGRGAIAPSGSVQKMFDQIVPRYDLMNHLMTGGRDVAWRKLAVKAARESSPARAIDVATGTGDLAFALAKSGIPNVIGLDFSGGMLEAAHVKVAGSSGIALVRGDGMALPLMDDAVDSLTVSFGLRNMPDYERAVAEFVRVVRPGGRVVILEMTPLSPSRFARGFNWYFEHVVPLVGGLLSGDRGAYAYLPASVAAFPDRDRLTRMLIMAGCRRVNVTSLGFGTVALHVGEVGEH